MTKNKTNYTLLLGIKIYILVVEIASKGKFENHIK